MDSSICPYIPALKVAERGTQTGCVSAVRPVAVSGLGELASTPLQSAPTAQAPGQHLLSVLQPGKAPDQKQTCPVYYVFVKDCVARLKTLELLLNISF